MEEQTAIPAVYREDSNCEDESKDHTKILQGFCVKCLQRPARTDVPSDNNTGNGEKAFYSEHHLLEMASTALVIFSDIEHR